MVRGVTSRVLIVGLGEVGSAIYSIVKNAGYKVFGYDLDPTRTINKLEEIRTPVDVIHVCYPYSRAFIEVTVEYIELFKPKLVLIESTVPPGTTEEIYGKTGVDIVHSPIRGKHPNLEKHLRLWTKWVGPATPEAGRRAKEYYESLGLKVKVAKSPRETELAKLIETTYRALLIAWWQEVHRIAKFFRVDVAEVAEFIAEVHRVLGDRPVYYPGIIGGHCLIPNTRIMQEIYPWNPLWGFILASNEKRAEELNDPETSREVEAVKKIWRELVPKWYYE